MTDQTTPIPEPEQPRPGQPGSASPEQPPPEPQPPAVEPQPPTEPQPPVEPQPPAEPQVQAPEQPQVQAPTLEQPQVQTPGQPQPTQPLAQPVPTAGAPYPPAAPGMYSAPAGSSPPPAPPGRVRRLWREATATTGARVATIAALGLVTLLVLSGLVGGAIALAGGHDDGPRRIAVGPGDRDLPNGKAPRGGPNQQQRPGPGTLPRLGDLRGLGALGGSLHGEVTADGGTVYLFQRGEVTKSSATSVTVKSSDGFTATYAVSDDTRVAGPNDVPAVGSDVLVVAKKDGSAAVRILALREGQGRSRT